jgi:hypothetical protein
MQFTDDGHGTGTLAGTPVAGSEALYPLTLTASNGVSPDATLGISLVVVPQLAISTTSLPAATVGTGYSGQVAASGGEPPATFTLDSGNLPDGLQLHGDGSIGGTPTGPAGTSSFTVRVTDGGVPMHQTATKALSIAVGRGVASLTVSPVVLDIRNLLGIKITAGHVEARLVGPNGAPLSGQEITWTAGGATVCVAVTDVNGAAQCVPTLADTLRIVLNLGVIGSYAGNSSYTPATATAGIVAL